MSLFKLSVLVACYAAGLSAATITSGTITYQHVASNVVWTYALQYSDGVFASGGTSEDNTYLYCIDTGQGCRFSGPSYAYLSNNFTTNIAPQLQITYGGDYLAVDGIASQTFSTNFSAEGFASAFYPSKPSAPCPFPDTALPAPFAGSQNCTIPLVGSGTVNSTIAGPYTGSGFLPSGYLYGFYLQQEVFTFTSTPGLVALTSTPEPSTLISAVAGITLFSLLRRRRASERNEELWGG